MGLNESRPTFHCFIPAPGSTAKPFVCSSIFAGDTIRVRTTLSDLQPSPLRHSCAGCDLGHFSDATVFDLQMGCTNRVMLFTVAPEW